MKKMRWFIIVAILVLAAAFFIFMVKKQELPLKIKEGGITSISGILNQAKEAEAGLDLATAKTAYQKLLNEFSNSAEVSSWQKKIDDLNIKLLFSPVITANSALYEIKPGDSVVKIAREFKTTPELIIRSNNLSSDKIFPGKKIKVWTAPFSILVDKSQNTLIVKVGEEIFKTYVVSTGVNNCTPVGNFKIINKLTNPTWYKAGAVVPAGSTENVLGSRWLGLDKPSYGIHGTTDPQSLGKQVTQGCVRLSNQDVEELYTYIPAGTEVTIVD